VATAPLQPMTRMVELEIDGTPVRVFEGATILDACKALGIDTHVHHHAQAVAGFDKAPVKAKIRALQAERDKALADRDHKQLKQIRRQIHRLNRKIRAATV